MEQVRVVIAQRNESTGRQLLRLVEEDDRLLLVGQAHNEDEVLEILRTQKPDMILSDSMIEKAAFFRSLYRVREPAMQSVVRDRPSDISEQIAEIRATQMIQKVGIPAHIKGYQYLRDAIVLVVIHPEMMESVTKVLYPNIARRNLTTPERVERAIRNAIEIGWERGRAKVLEDLFGYTVHNTRGKPTNSEFIAMLADKIRLEYRLRGR